MKEGGLKDFELVLYSGILAPRDCPRAIVDKLNAELGRIVRLPELEKIFSRVGAIAVTNSPDAFAQHINAELSKLGKLVALSGARID
jgi:tripartite-type tricarboxylate transporter receptor subunit TctC